MKRFAILLTIGLVIACTAQAQTTEDSVKTVINRLFEGMKNADTALLKSAFGDSPILQTIATDKKGKVYIKTEKYADFVKATSQQKPGQAD